MRDLLTATRLHASALSSYETDGKEVLKVASPKESERQSAIPSIAQLNRSHSPSASIPSALGVPSIGMLSFVRRCKAT